MTCLELKFLIIFNKTEENFGEIVNNSLFCSFSEQIQPPSFFNKSGKIFFFSTRIS